MMAKRQIDFQGPSLSDLGIEVEEKSQAKISKSKKGVTKISNTENFIEPKESAKKEEVSSTEFSNNNISITKRRYKTVQLDMVRNALIEALGDKEKVEVKLCDLIEQLGMHPNTFYKHLKTLRGTDFEVAKLRYCTIITRKTISH